MKKINNNNVGSSFLQRLFPYSGVDNDVIKEEDARIAAAAAATAAKESEDIENENTSKKKEDTNGNSQNPGGGGINIGTINGGIHFHFGGNDTNTSSRHADDDDFIIDAEFVDITDDTSQQKKTVQTPLLTTQQSSSQSMSKKQELTRSIRIGDFDAIKELDRLIESGDTKLNELFVDNRPLCLWIKRPTQKQRFSKLPALVQELINTQVNNQN